MNTQVSKIEQIIENDKNVRRYVIIMLPQKIY
jgi:hypothetical protein